MADYRKEARRAATRYGIDPRIFERQIGQESGFNPSARSPAGATGIAQIMPGTARAWGVDPTDPVAALDAAAKNMARYLKRFGSYEKALAAYNAGEGAVQKYGGVPPYRETQNYVAKILNGASPAAPKQSAAGGTSAASTIVAPQVGFDQGGYDAALRRSIVGRLLANQGQNEHNNPLFASGVLGTQAPDPAQFATVANRVMRTTAPQGRADGMRKARQGLRPSGGYAGSKGAADELRAIGEGLGLKVMSAKRHNTNPYSGKGSDHDHGNTNAYAYDLSNGSAPTREMDRAAFRIMQALGFKDYKMGQPIDARRGVTTINGLRYQVIYRGSGAAFGGNHLNHVHVGVRRVG